jgi:hypothetical protein
LISDETEVLIEQLEPGFQPYALHLVQQLRLAGIPAMVISARRSSSVNQAVGGATRSLHLYGRAVDLQIAGYTRDQVPLWWWEALGQFWESMGGRWGGRFSPPDVNHFDDGTWV